MSALARLRLDAVRLSQCNRGRAQERVIQVERVRAYTITAAPCDSLDRSTSLGHQSTASHDQPQTLKDERTPDEHD